MRTMSFACEIIYFFVFFFFNDTATTEIYTLSLHDALPICLRRQAGRRTSSPIRWRSGTRACAAGWRDRRSTRLNSSHLVISYAVFCLKKKKNHHTRTHYLLTNTTTPLTFSL